MFAAGHVGSGEGSLRLIERNEEGEGEGEGKADQQYPRVPRLAFLLGTAIVSTQYIEEHDLGKNRHQRLILTFLL